MNRQTDSEDWKAFVSETYGSTADSPIERGDQGDFEKRADSSHPALTPGPSPNRTPEPPGEGSV